MIASQWISRAVVSYIGSALVLTPLDYRPDLLPAQLSRGQLVYEAIY